MEVTSHRREQPPCMVEIHVHGLLYIRIERCPRWLVPVLAAAFPLIGTWLLTR